MLAGNTSDRTTLRGFLERIEKLYGKAERIWVMDRGIPTEEVLAEMRQSQRVVQVQHPAERLERLVEAAPARRNHAQEQMGARLEIAQAQHALGLLACLFVPAAMRVNPAEQQMGREEGRSGLNEGIERRLRFRPFARAKRTKAALVLPGGRHVRLNWRRGCPVSRPSRPC